MVCSSVGRTNKIYPTIMSYFILPRCNVSDIRDEKNSAQKKKRKKKTSTMTATATATVIEATSVHTFNTTKSNMNTILRVIVLRRWSVIA